MQQKDETSFNKIPKQKEIAPSLFEIMKGNASNESQGLNFRAGWRDSRPKVRNPFEKNRKGGRLPPIKILGFPEMLVLMKRSSLFTKSLPIFV